MSNQVDPLGFENLDFSFLIDRENRIAYLQEWEDGAWSEPEHFSLPVSLALAPKKSRLARAAKSFGDAALREVLEEGLERPLQTESRSLWSFVQSFMRALAFAGGSIEETCPIPAPLSSATPSSSNQL